MYNTLIIVSRFISEASTVPMMGSQVSNAKVIEILKNDLPLLCKD